MVKSADVKHLSRADLLEIMVAQSKQIDALIKENQELKEELGRKELAITKAGSMAEAALKLGGVFEAIDRAADIYLSTLEARYADAARMSSDVSKQSLQERSS